MAAISDLSLELAQRVNGPIRLKLSLWLLVALVGLNASALIAGPLAIAVHRAQATQSDRSTAAGQDRAAKQVSSPRVMIATVIRKDGRFPLPPPDLLESGNVQIAPFPADDSTDVEHQSGTDQTQHAYDARGPPSA